MESKRKIDGTKFMLVLVPLLAALLAIITLAIRQSQPADAVPPLQDSAQEDADVSAIRLVESADTSRLVDALVIVKVDPEAMALDLWERYGHMPELVPMGDTILLVGRCAPTKAPAGDICFHRRPW